jgi:hypothetical protein
MKKLVFVVVLVVLVMALFPSLAGAASTAYIDVTATGSDLDITVRKVSDNATIWAIGAIHASDTDNTAINWGEIVNNTSQAINVSINGNEMVTLTTGPGTTWTMAADNTTPGAGTFVMKLGVDDADDTFDMVIGDYDWTPYTKILFDAVDALGASATWNFGLKFWAPTSLIGNDAMIMTDLDASEWNVVDSTNGLCFIATLDT